MTERATEKSERKKKQVRRESRKELAKPPSEDGPTAETSNAAKRFKQTGKIELRNRH